MFILNLHLNNFYCIKEFEISSYLKLPKTINIYETYFKLEYKENIIQTRKKRVYLIFIFSSFKFQVQINMVLENHYNQ